MTDAATDTMETADILRVMALLPHRFPFLLVDRIIEMRGDESCIGIKNVTANEPHFQGHFPHRPIMPGVLLVEGMAQTAGALCVASQLAVAAVPKAVYFMTIDNVKFRKPVTPGDVVRYHMTKMRNRANMWWFRGEAKVDGQIVCEAEISAMLMRD